MFYLRLLQVPRSEWVLTGVGQLFDMVACWQIMHGAKEKAPEVEFWDYVRQFD
ncbi:MAG: hypothetical protein IJB67_01755 [Firmicutes bacterium]|nr:hypothetical protein [Bacillota bacterium]